MGIYIRLNIIPDQISKKDWNSAYKEAEQLINAYPFLDVASDDDAYGCSWNYADSPSEGPIEYCDNNIGFRMSGDLVTMKTAESFELIRDLDYYYRRGFESKKECKDILQFYADHLEGTARVFADKTQGYDYHRYILAIACLFEDRLKPYALVSDDISRGQLESAIQWANGVLKKPINISDRAKNEILLARIRRVVLDKSTALSLFMEATLNEKDYQCGCFIRENFNKETITNYFSTKISDCKIGTFGFSDILTEYLNLGNDLTDLCDICINKDSDTNTIGLFIKAIFELGVHLSFEDKVRSEQRQLEKLFCLQSDDPYSKTPDTVGSMFGKIFSMMTYGNKHQSRMYIPLDKLTEIFKEKFGEFCDVDGEISKYVDKEQEKEFEKPLAKTLLTGNQKNEVIEKYDIENLDNLILWEPEMTIQPQLEKFILRVKDFVDGDIGDNSKLMESSLKSFEHASKKDRMRHLINHNRYFLISKKMWNYLEKKIDDFNFFRKIIRILKIDAQEIKINRLALIILNNNRILEEYILNNQIIDEKTNGN